MAKITFIQHNGTEQTVEGLPGMSVMETAVKNMVPGIDADCGGACACATCHVYVDPDWAAAAGTPGPEEVEMLTYTVEPAETSRLSCQIKISAALDGLVIRIPAFGIPMLGFEFMGLDTTDSVSSAPAGVFTAWQRPRVVNETNASVWRIGSTYSAGTVSGGTQLVNGDFEIRIGNDVQHQKLLNGRMIEIVQRRVTCTGTLFFSASAENSHLAFAYADTLVGLGFTHGNAVGQTVGLHCGGVQILNLEPAEYQGREVLAATFQITPTSGNDELRLFSR